MHDLGSLTLNYAILRHKGEAQRPISVQVALPPAQQQQLITFLKFL